MIPCIGLFDSGVGGLSVLRAVRQLLPQAKLLYVADSGHAPYGERDDAFVQDRSLRMARFLRDQGAQLLVVACNTATASAIGLLRQVHPDLPIVGVEPGIKPAVALSRGRRVGVLATEGTLRSEKFRRLMRAHAGDVQLHLQPCPGLALAIEQGDADGPQVRELVRQFCGPLRHAQVDVVVLGCTHYTFASHHICAELGQTVALVDTAEAVARHAMAQLKDAAVSTGTTAACEVQLWTSGDPSSLRDIAHRWLPFACQVKALASA